MLISSAKRAAAAGTVFLVSLSLVSACPAQASSEAKGSPKQAALSAAPEIERQTLERMLKDDAWPRRAIAALRLERYGCDQSGQHLEALLRDTAWQVRAFAIRSLAHRRIAAKEDWFSAEPDPRVLRAALRYRYDFDSQRLKRGVEALAKSSGMKDKILAAELAAVSGDEELARLARETIKQIIVRMNRAEAGALSPRLAALTGERHLTRPHQWQQWLMKKGRRFELRPVFNIEEGEKPIEPALLGRLETEQFVGLENYMAELSEHEVDLAICLDCTASMGREITAAQAGIDDMMLFVGDVVASLRVALVAYRDRGDEFETRAWEFSNDLSKLREQLWQLSADGGGDEPEAVHPAMKLALTQLHWRPDSMKILVLVGDAPPHVGYGTLSVNLAQRANEQAQLITHVIQAKGKDVKHFAEIAKAGGGRCVSLKEADTLMAEITGLTLGDRYSEEFREFFRIYLELCR